MVSVSNTQKSLDSYRPPSSRYSGSRPFVVTVMPQRRIHFIKAQLRDTTLKHANVILIAIASHLSSKQMTASIPSLSDRSPVAEVEAAVPTFPSL